MFPNDYVNIGGLGGLPFGGRHAFHSLLKHVPDSCCLLMLLSTHTGFDPAGNLGFVQRLDENDASVASLADLYGAHESISNTDGGA